MLLVQQWRDLEAGLTTGWGRAQLRLTVDDGADPRRAAALLGPAQPVSPEHSVLRFATARGGQAIGPEGLVRLLARLDDEGIGGRLELVGSEAAAAPVADLDEPRPLAAAWDDALAALPADWSDLYAEVELLSSDYFDRASVLCTPMNPRRVGDRVAFRFRSARRFGYGTSPQMVRRCLERCDADRLQGSVTVLRALSDTRPVATQGPVWLADGVTF